MQFDIDYSIKKEERKISYDLTELSFNVTPRTKMINFELSLNYLTLSVIGIENRIGMISGYCGNKKLDKV